MYALRLAGLLLFFALMAGWDRWRYGAEARRAREYLFCLSLAAIGGAFGAGFDQLSVTLSPDYFVLAKGLDAGPGLRWEVAGLGFQAGVFGGLVAAMTLLLVNQPAPEMALLPDSTLFRLALWVLAGALAGALAGLIVGLAVGPLGSLSGELREIGLSAEASDRAGRVQVLHLGLYMGAAASLIGAAAAARRRRKAAPVSPR